MLHLEEKRRCNGPIGGSGREEKGTGYFQKSGSDENQERSETVVQAEYKWKKRSEKDRGGQESAFDGRGEIRVRKNLDEKRRVSEPSGC